MTLSAFRPVAFFLMVFTALLVGNGVFAADLPQPTGKVLLTVGGNIANTTSGKVAEFDRQQLESLGWHEVTTSNPFVKTVNTYAGPYLSELLDYVGATGEVIKARALDGYIVEIPIVDARQYPIVMAMTRDGKVMRVRDKGPIWIIYPVDQFAELNAESYSGRSIWQLSDMTVE